MSEPLVGDRYGMELQAVEIGQRRDVLEISVGDFTIETNEPDSVEEVSPEDVT